MRNWEEQRRRAGLWTLGVGLIGRPPSESTPDEPDRCHSHELSFFAVDIQVVDQEPGEVSCWCIQSLCVSLQIKNYHLGVITDLSEGCTGCRAEQR